MNVPWCLRHDNCSADSRAELKIDLIDLFLCVIIHIWQYIIILHKCYHLEKAEAPLIWYQQFHCKHKFTNGIDIRPFRSDKTKEASDITKK